MKTVMIAPSALLVACAFIACASAPAKSDEQAARGNAAVSFASETLTTRLVPVPYAIDDSPHGVYGLNGTTWYVDGTNGSDANAGTSESLAFKTIQKGVDSSGPGDKIYVMNGTYRFEANSTTQQINFYQHSGADGHWILLANYPGHHPKLEFSWWDAIIIQGSSYVIVSGFTIQGPRNAITPEDALAHAKSTDNAYYNGCGIAITSCWDKRDTYSSHIIAANNVVYDCSGGGINASNADYITFRSNIVAYNSFWSPSGPSGISFYEFHDSNPSDRDIRNQISENVSFGNDNCVPGIFDPHHRMTDGNGIALDSMDVANPSYTGKTLVENNICFDNGGHGICVTRSDRLVIRNNTCYFNMKRPSAEGAEVVFINERYNNVQYPATDTVVMNNIFVSRHATKSNTYACAFGSVADKAGYRFSNNIFDGGIKVYIGGGVTPANALTNLFDVDPMFGLPDTDPRVADFSLLAGSPALDKCARAPAIDFSGHNRPIGSLCDMGALERQ